MRTIGIMARLLDQDDGLGVYSQYLIRHLLEQDPRTHYVIFLRTPRYQDAFRAYPNVTTAVLPSRSLLYWDQVRAVQAARRYDVDLIFNPKFSVPLLTSRPCVFVHQGWDWYANPANYEWWDNGYIRLMLPLYNWKATRTLAISQATVDGLREHTGMTLGDCHVSYAGIGPNFTAVRDEVQLQEFRQQHALPPRFILTVLRAYHGGHNKQRVYPGGNIDRLAKAYRAYRKQGGELPLVVAGARIEEYLRERDFTTAELADMHFMGFVPNTEMHLAYQAAECVMLGTLCESFGFPIVEAFACGCPAIVPNTCASPEIAGGAARLVNPLIQEEFTQALLEVTASQAVRQSLRERGLQRARELTWQQTARATLHVFDQIIPHTIAPEAGEVAT